MGAGENGFGESLSTGGRAVELSRTASGRNVQDRDDTAPLLPGILSRSGYSTTGTAAEKSRKRPSTWIFKNRSGPVSSLYKPRKIKGAAFNFRNTLYKDCITGSHKEVVS